jgi:hypothetical protein
VDDLDMRQLVTMMQDTYGPDAVVEAWERAGAAMERGDDESALLWRTVMIEVQRPPNET